VRPVIPDELALGRRGVEPLRDRAAVLDDRDDIGDRANLVEPVRDVDDGDAAAPQLADRGEQRGDLATIEDGRGLVHDDEPRVVRERSRDAHHLLLRRRERLDERAARDAVRADAAEQRLGGASRCGAIGDAAAADFVAEIDVLRDREAADEIELLVDRRDPEPQRVRRPLQHDGRALPEQLAAVGPLRARDDLDERALTGAVLPESRVDFARPHL